jgi:hypothetical protein
LRALVRTLPKRERADFEQLLRQTEPLLAYMERQPEIEAASAALEAHRRDFEALTGNERAYMDRARALFAEEQFLPLRFTAEDARRAFEKLGPPSPSVADDAFVERVRAAILHLADKDYRSQASMSLLLQLPDYVAAGRWLDAWLVQHCALLTAESPDESNPFLFQMFSYGYDAWAAGQRQCDEALLRELGLDSARLENMSMDELDAWLQTQQANPALEARLKNLLDAHPDQRSLAEANLRQVEFDSVKLLTRADAAGLLLSAEELAPWLPRLNEWLATALEQTGGGASNAELDETEKDALVDQLVPLLREITDRLFTQERRQQLVAQLRAYRNARFAAGDKPIAVLASGAMHYVEREDAPALNRFLVCLCYASLLRASTAASAVPPEA